jgi:hypothetical protein
VIVVTAADQAFEEDTLGRRCPSTKRIILPDQDRA